MDQPYIQPQPQFVVMPVPQRNGLGVFGFFVALVGLFIPTGVVALLGLVLSLAAIGRSPRGFATFGVILGLLGSAMWLAIMALVGVLGVVAVAGVAVAGIGAFLLTQPEVVEVTSDMVNVAIALEEYHQEHDEMPEELAGLGLGLATRIDPWGAPYRFAPADEEPGFDVVSGGPDGAFDTDDDIRLSRLDQVWEDAFESFDQRMEELCERLERMDGIACGGGSSGSSDECGWGGRYERAARRQLAADHGAP